MKLKKMTFMLFALPVKPDLKLGLLLNQSNNQAASDGIESVQSDGCLMFVRVLLLLLFDF